MIRNKIKYNDTSDVSKAKTCFRLSHFVFRVMVIPRMWPLPRLITKKSDISIDIPISIAVNTK